MAFLLFGIPPGPNPSRGSYERVVPWSEKIKCGRDVIILPLETSIIICEKNDDRYIHIPKKTYLSTRKKEFKRSVLMALFCVIIMKMITTFCKPERSADFIIKTMDMLFASNKSMFGVFMATTIFIILCDAYGRSRDEFSNVPIGVWVKATRLKDDDGYFKWSVTQKYKHKLNINYSGYKFLHEETYVRYL